VPKRADQVYDGLYVHGVPMNLVLIAHYAIQGLILLIVASSLMSWFSPDPRNPLVRGLHAVVDPLLHPIRSLMPGNLGLDFSPMIAILVLWVLQNLLQRGFAS